MEWVSLGVGLAYVVLGVLLLVVAKVVKDFVTPYKLDDQLTSKDNPALALSVTGYYIGVIIIFLGAAIGADAAQLTTQQLVTGMLIDVAYALGGIVLLNLGRGILDRIVLRQFSTIKEIIEDRNVGTGAVEFGSYVATALIVAGAIFGEIPAEAAFAGAFTGPITALAFFVIGQITLVLFSLFYQFITKYDIYCEIEKDNVAAGVAFGANMIAIGVIVLKAATQQFSSFQVSVGEYVILAVVGFVALFLIRLVVDHILLPNTTLKDEIARDRNIGAAWIEGAVAIGMATIIFFMV